MATRIQKLETKTGPAATTEIPVEVPPPPASAIVLGGSQLVVPSVPNVTINGQVSTVWGTPTTMIGDFSFGVRHRTGIVPPDYPYIDIHNTGIYHIEMTYTFSGTLDGFRTSFILSDTGQAGGPSTPDAVVGITSTPGGAGVFTGVLTWTGVVLPTFGLNGHTEFTAGSAGFGTGGTYTALLKISQVLKIL